MLKINIFWFNFEKPLRMRHPFFWNDLFCAFLWRKILRMWHYLFQMTRGSGHFSLSINKYPTGIMAFLGARKANNKIQGYIVLHLLLGMSKGHKSPTSLSHSTLLNWHWCHANKCQMYSRLLLRAHHGIRK